MKFVYLGIIKKLKVMKLEKLLVGAMLTLAVGGLLTVISVMILGEFDFSNFSYISLKGE